MILGTGIDIIELERIKSSIDKFGETFLNRIYTKNEQLEASKRSNQITFFAGRWAVKEAIAKALGTGFGEYCNWLDLEITNDKSNKPIVKLTGNALKTFNNLEATAITISISHSHNNAIAFAIIEKN